MAGLKSGGLLIGTFLLVYFATPFAVDLLLR